MKEVWIEGSNFLYGDREKERNFDGAVQHAKACIGRDDLVLKSKQVEAFEGALSGQRLLCVATDRLWQEPLLPASPVFI